MRSARRRRCDCIALLLDPVPKHQAIFEYQRPSTNRASGYGEEYHKAVEANVKDNIDTRFVKEPEDTGFVKGLYKT
jgi:hypothetical protein